VDRGEVGPPQFVQELQPLCRRQHDSGTFLRVSQ
jgi:hypothetical protein